MEEVEETQHNWLDIKRGDNETLNDYASCVQQLSEELSKTCCWWCRGLGYGFKELNQVIQMTGNTSAGWEENLSIIIINQKATKFLKQEGHTGMCPQETLQSENHQQGRQQPHQNQYRPPATPDQQLPQPPAPPGRVQTPSPSTAGTNSNTGRQPNPPQYVNPDPEV
eukprot:15333127-Ditylum_brightwellii.AAC.2